MLYKYNKITFAAGKSGGHIIPCLTLAHNIKTYNPLFKASFLTTSSPLDISIMSHYSNLYDVCQTVPLERIPSHITGYFSFIIDFTVSIIKSFLFFYKTQPDIVFSTGGIVALPATIAAYIMNIPIHLYELNTKPGKAIEYLSHIADTIYTTFDDISFDNIKQKPLYLPYPIRYTQEELNTNSSDARRSLGLNPSKHTITILGGSQGSESLNMIIKNMIEHLKVSPHDVQFIHQTGSHHVEFLKNLYKEYGFDAYVFGYAHNLTPMYAAADLIIGRAGAGTIFECHAFFKKTILVPLETVTTDHQKNNALQAQKFFSNVFSVAFQKDLESHNGDKIAEYIFNFIPQRIENEIL